MRHTRKRTSVNAIPSIITTSVVTMKKISILRKSFIAVVPPLYAKTATMHAFSFRTRDDNPDKRSDDDTRNDVREPVKTDRCTHGDGDREEERRVSDHPILGIAYEKCCRERTGDCRMRRRPPPKYPVLQETEIEIAAAVDKRCLREKLGLNSSRERFVERRDYPCNHDRLCAHRRGGNERCVFSYLPRHVPAYGPPDRNKTSADTSRHGERIKVRTAGHFKKIPIEPRHHERIRQHHGGDMIENILAAVHREKALRKSVRKCPEHYFIFTPLNARPFFAIWSTKRPVFVSTLVHRLLRLDRTCARFFTSPLRPCPLGPFFAIPESYTEETGKVQLSTPLEIAPEISSIGTHDKNLVLDTTHLFNLGALGKIRTSKIGVESRQFIR